jgi:hypothetical protein
MRTDPTPTFYLFAAIAASTAFTIYTAVASLRDIEPSNGALRLWGALFAILLVGWIKSDSRGRANTFRPFCCGSLLFLLAVPYAPYYLVKTRGLVGLLWILGGVVVYCAGFIVPLFVGGAS